VLNEVVEKHLREEEACECTTVSCTSSQSENKMLALPLNEV
jgi:hypothetical protein